MTPAAGEPDERPRTNVTRVVIAVVGIILAFVLINGGLNLLSSAGNEQPTPVSTTVK